MPNIVIDQEFKSLLPSLDKDTYALLEENLMQNGCRDSLVLWGDILVDGHNRYEICTAHDIPFNIIYKDFKSREDALIWIISTQVSRRNLTPIQLSHFRGVHYRADKKIIKNESGANQYKEVKSQNGTKPQNQSTATRLADQYNVSRNTINRDAKIAEAIDAIGESSPEAKRMILSGEIKLSKKELEALSDMTNNELAEIALEIEGGTYEKRKSDTGATVEADGVSGGGANPIFDATGDSTVSIFARPGGSSGSMLSGTQSFDTAIGKIAEAFYAELRKLAEKDDAAGLKTALRSHIDMLEDLYRQM